MKRLKIGVLTALAVISLAIAGCQDSGTDGSVDDLISDDALPSVGTSAPASAP
jgi:hypothetical protein